MAKTSKICENRPMSDVTMWKARHTDYRGQEKIVQLANMPLEKDSVYFSPGIDKGKLCCAYCNVGVHYNRGAPSVAGTSFSGRDPHFVTDKGKKHDEGCLWELRDPSQSIQDIDTSKGYRIHINMRAYHPIFNQASEAYRQNKNGIIKIIDPNLHGMERLVVRSAKDLVHLLLRGEFDRVNDSRIIFQNRIIDWERFCLHYKYPERFVELLDRVQRMLKGEPVPYCLIEIKTKPHHFRGFEKDRRIGSEGIWLNEPDYRGARQVIAPSVFINNHTNTGALDSFSYGEGSYFVMGQVRYNRIEKDDITFHNFNISVTDGTQVIKCDPREIARIGRDNAARRENRSINSPAP